MSLRADDRADAREWVRRLAPAFTVITSSLIMCLPLPLAWGVMPHFAFLFVLIWASLQPRLMPAWCAFLLGLWHDMLTGQPLGFNALLFGACVVVVRLVEDWIESRSLLIDWVMAGLLVVAAQFVAWQMMAFLGFPVPLLPFLAQAALTLLAFPLATAAAARIQRRLVGADG